jgi:DNA invertase Pin-like site-specific DNA recombinase
MKSIGYVRVSTEKQADFGVSLEAQAEKVRAMAVVFLGGFRFLFLRQSHC